MHKSRDPSLHARKDSHALHPVAQCRDAELHMLLMTSVEKGSKLDYLLDIPLEQK